MNLKQAKELVRSRLSDKRYEHTINVKKMAVKLAKHYGVDEDKAALAEETPVGRLGSADEVAQLLVFLAGEGAGYITGQVFGVNGGLVI